MINRALRSLCACAILIPGIAVPQPVSASRDREIQEILESSRCNLATAYRLGPREALKVRAAPTTGSTVITYLREGSIVYVCDQDNHWLKVFFGGAEGPCFRTYEGGLAFREAKKCRSGWVPEAWVNILSG
jgi:hypothetical protein